MDAVLWLALTAAPWRDLPPGFGKWTGAHARSRRRAVPGVWERLSNAPSVDPDLEYVLIDSTIGKAQADATGGRGTQTYGIGRSRGGLTIRIHAADDAIGLPVRLAPTAGQRGDSPQVALIDGFVGVGHVIADAACDPGALRGKKRR